MIYSIALRNIWRSILRSSVIMIAITIGIFAGVFTWAFYRGMVNQRIDSAIATEVSNIQIHKKGYKENPDVKDYITSSREISDKLNHTEGIKAFSPRLLANAMILSAETGTGIKLVGIDTSLENRVSDIHTKITEGEFLGGIKRNPIVIGDDLANKLNIRLRSKVVVTLQQMDGEITRAKFTVAGIFSTTNSMYDNANAFVRKSDLSRILNIEDDAVHQIAIVLNDNSLQETITSTLQNLFPELDIKGWRELLPEVSLIEESMDISMYFIMIIILIALCFGIVNTMLMAILERVKELGMLMAIGMTRLRVFLMIMTETVYLAILGGGLGIVLGVSAVSLKSKSGMDLSAWSDAYERMGIGTVVYPVMDIDIIVKITIMVVITGIIGAIFPAIRALKLNPSEAIRSDM